MINHEQVLRLKGVALGGEIIIPDAAHGLILFAHGSGSSRHSPRPFANQQP